MELQKLRNGSRARPTVALVLLRWRNPQRLADVFLVNTSPPYRGANAVIAFDDDGNLFAESHHSGLGGEQAHRSRQFQTEMFVLSKSCEGRGRGFEYVRGWGTA